MVGAVVFKQIRSPHFCPKSFCSWWISVDVSMATCTANSELLNSNANAGISPTWPIELVLTLDSWRHLQGGVSVPTSGHCLSQGPGMAARLVQLGFMIEVELLTLSLPQKRIEDNQGHHHHHYYCKDSVPPGRMEGSQQNTSSTRAAGMLVCL